MRRNRPIQRIARVVSRGLRLLERDGLRGLATYLSSGEWLRRSSYPEWIARYDEHTERDRALMRDRIAGLARAPVVSLMLPVAERRSVDSVRAQIYPSWELLVAEDAASQPPVPPWLAAVAAADERVRVVRPEDALEAARGEFVAKLDPGDALAEHALYVAIEELLAHPEAVLVYTDEDEVDQAERRSRPWFKCDWNPDLLLSQDCIGRLALYRKTTLMELGGLGEDHDLALRLSEHARPENLRHVPHVLYHRHERVAPRAAPDAVRAHLKRRGIDATVEGMDEPGCFRVLYPLPVEPPLVSVIVPDRDGGDLLRACLEGVLRRTRYPRLELLVVNNGSKEPGTLGYYRALAQDPRVRVLDHDAPFNFAALNNWAVERAEGALLALLNNDTEVISRDWLGEMVRHALRTEIGAVGAKLYYPDDTVQHAGVILGVGGIAGHAHHGLPRGRSGYHGRAGVVQNFSAVTAACMVLRREVFREVGGFDAEGFGVAFNDVDLCLRIAARGYRILWTPFAELHHYESASLGGPGSRERRVRFQEEGTRLRERWKGAIERDPAYNPNLTLRRGDFSLAFPPRVTKPWLPGGGPER